jgi:LmbE family N-acetylglucosaminyl deacetylase
MTRTRVTPGVTVAGYMTATTVLSPHPDDAVLSVWHVLAGPGEVAVVNVFAGKPDADELAWWDSLSAAADPQSRMAERWAEDREALALVGREPTNLEFIDLQYRRAEQRLKPLTEAIEAVAPTGLLLAPADLAADHPDHALVRDAALALRDRGRDVALYADLPHATRNGLPPSWRLSLNGTGVATEQIEPEVRRLSPEEATHKREAFERYQTQVAPLDEMFGLAEHPERLHYEVTWRLPGA